MKISKGTIVSVNHSRKGKFQAMAIKDFDTQKEEFYPLALVTPRVKGMNNDWVTGEEIPCRNSLCKIATTN